MTLEGVQARSRWGKIWIRLYNQKNTNKNQIAIMKHWLPFHLPLTATNSSDSKEKLNQYNFTITEIHKIR